MSKMQTKTSCILVTWFDKNQPGYLDFSYRIETMSRHYALTVVSQFEFTQEELIYPNVEYHVIDVPGNRFGWLKYLWKSAQFIRQRSPGVVVLLSSILSPLKLLIGQLPTALYWNEHPSNFARKPKQFDLVKTTTSILLQKVLFFGARLCELVMPIGEDHRNNLLEKGLHETQLRMVYMGVDASFLLESKLDVPLTDTLNLIYVGTISAERGRDVMLEAMQLLQAEGASVTLSLVGATEAQLEETNSQIKKNNLLNVKVYPRVSGKQIPHFLDGADLAICLWPPNNWNQFNPPTKLFEYLVAGLPVLASDIRTHSRYINEGENGWLFDYSAKGLASVIHKAIENKQYIRHMQSNARISGARYLWEKIESTFLYHIKWIEGLGR
jgi:glycosyltransferase involved in cell wall biosynthesis